MKTVHVLAALALASFTALPACSGSTSPQSAGLTGDGDLTPSPTSKDGVPYPTVGVGTANGQVIKNLAFLGYPDGTHLDTMETVSLADYFDPNGTQGIKLIHIQAAGLWCGPCNQEADMVAASAAQLKSKGVVWIAAIIQGAAQGSESTQPDLDTWIARHHAPVPHVLDPGNTALGTFIKTGGIPWNISIDAKTMKIVSAQSGSPSDATGLMQEIDADLAAAAAFSQ